MLTVIRKSGAVDMFPIVIEDSIVRDNDYNGKEVVVTGAIRSMDTSKNPRKSRFYSLYFMGKRC